MNILLLERGRRRSNSPKLLSSCSKTPNDGTGLSLGLAPGLPSEKWIPSRPLLYSCLVPVEPCPKFLRLAQKNSPQPDHQIRGLQAFLQRESRGKESKNNRCRPSSYLSYLKTIYVSVWKGASSPTHGRSQKAAASGLPFLDLILPWLWVIAPLGPMPFAHQVLLRPPSSTGHKTAHRWLPLHPGAVALHHTQKSWTLPPPLGSVFAPLASQQLPRALRPGFKSDSSWCPPALARGLVPQRGGSTRVWQPTGSPNPPSLNVSFSSQASFLFPSVIARTCLERQGRPS